MRRILIVDDEKAMVNMIRRALALVKEIEIDAVHDGLAAVERFTAFKPDLVLLDMRMPGLDGYEVCRAIRSHPEGSQVKIIMISGAMDMDAVERVAQVGANDFLAKPFRNEFLQLKVERILAANKEGA